MMQWVQVVLFFLAELDGKLLSRRETNLTADVRLQKIITSTYFVHRSIFSCTFSEVHFPLSRRAYTAVIRLYNWTARLCPVSGAPLRVLCSKERSGERSLGGLNFPEANEKRTT